MKAVKKYYVAIAFRIGVNVIGLPLDFFLYVDKGFLVTSFSKFY